MQLYPNVNDWISDAFDEYFLQLVRGDRDNGDVQGVLRRLEERHVTEHMLPRDVAGTLALYDLAAHYTRDISRTGRITSLVRADISNMASAFASKGSSYNDSNWFAAQRDLANGINIVNFPRDILTLAKALEGRRLQAS